LVQSIVSGRAVFSPVLVAIALVDSAVELHSVMMRIVGEGFSHTVSNG